MLEPKVADLPAAVRDSAAPDRRVTAMGFSVFNGALDEIPVRRPCSTVQTISPNSYGMSTGDPAFRTALREADYLVLDGVYFGLAGLLLKGQTIRPNQGPDVFYHFMQRMNASGGRVFFLGSTEATLAKIRARAATDYPNIVVETLSPPFKPEFSEAENAAMIEAINAFRPDVVFVGMTAPKQEKWAHRHRDRLDAGLVASIGAVFDWFAGNEKPIAPIWWKLKLGWLVRTIQRPEILKRYPKIGIFFWHLALARVGVKRYPAND